MTPTLHAHIERQLRRRQQTTEAAVTDFERLKAEQFALLDARRVRLAEAFRVGASRCRGLWSLP